MRKTPLMENPPSPQEKVPFWKNPKTHQPEKVMEYWCLEETAQEVLIQYVRAKRYEFCVGWYEDGLWWSNDEIIPYPIVAWSYLPEKHQPEIEWDFVMWNEKCHNEAQLKGEDEYGIKYFGTGNWYEGELLYPAKDVEPIL